MAEIDTRPLESVQAPLTLFELRSDQSRFSSPDRNEPKIDVVTRELASCKLQLEVKESESKQASLKIAALHKAMRDLSEKYDRACLDAHGRITELEADNGVIASQQAATASECGALRDELAVVRGELDAVKRANAYVLGEVESMETRRILERENTREALGRILELNDAVLSSAVAAIRAEEERSVFFQEVMLELFNSDRNLEVIRRQQETMEAMEEEVLTKTVEVEYLRSELKQLRELYVSSEPVSCECIRRNGEVSKTAAKYQEQGDCSGSPEIAHTYFDTELPREDRQNIQSENVVEAQEEPKKQVCFVAEVARVDFKSGNSDDKDMNTGVPENMAGNQELQAPTSAACKGKSEDADTGFATEIVTVIYKDDGEFYTKEIGGADKLDDGYVLVAKKTDGDALKDGKLDAAHAEISDLRFSLEEAVRRAELAEEAKAALERELRQEIQKKQRPPPRPRALASEETRDRKALPAPPSRPPRSAPRPSPNCLTLGKVLNMKFK